MDEQARADLLKPKTGAPEPDDANYAAHNYQAALAAEGMKDPSADAGPEAFLEHAQEVEEQEAENAATLPAVVEDSGATKRFKFGVGSQVMDRLLLGSPAMTVTHLGWDHTGEIYLAEWWYESQHRSKWYRVGELKWVPAPEAPVGG